MTVDVDVGEVGEEEVPGDVVEQEGEEDQGVPVRPPGPAGLAVRLGWLDVLCREIPGENIVECRAVVVVRVLLVSHGQQTSSHSHQEDGEPQERVGRGKVLHPAVSCSDDEEDVGQTLDLVEAGHQAAQHAGAVALQAGHHQGEHQVETHQCGDGPGGIGQGHRYVVPSRDTGITT